MPVGKHANMAECYVKSTDRMAVVYSETSWQSPQDLPEWFPEDNFLLNQPWKVFQRGMLNQLWQVFQTLPG